MDVSIQSIFPCNRGEWIGVIDLSFSVLQKYCACDGKSIQERVFKSRGSEESQVMNPLKVLL